MSEGIDFDSDQQILMSVSGAGDAAREAGGTLQIQLPDGYILAYTEHPFLGKTGDALQEAVDSVRATWKMRQAMHESAGKRRPRTPVVGRDNHLEELPLSDGELLMSASEVPVKHAAPSAGRIIMPDSIARGTPRAETETQQETDDSGDPLASTERQLRSAKKRFAAAEKDLDDAQRRYDKAQQLVAKWQRAFDALEDFDGEED
jgi:hypothetical protein